MKMAELLENTEEELGVKRDEIRSEMMNLRFQAAKGVLENPARIRILRRDVARIETIIRKRQLSKNKETEG